MSSQLVAPTEFSVVTWNILLDKTRTQQGLISPQSERVCSVAESLRNLTINLDVVVLQEVEGHNGADIAAGLGYDDGFWFEHNTSRRKREHIGVFGDLVTSAESIDVGYDKKAVITHLGDVAIIGIHHRKEFWGPMRAEQMRTVLDAVKDIERVVIVGDTNALPVEKSRRMLRRHGFEPVYTQLGQTTPKTHPTDRYKSIMYALWQRKLIPNGTSLDIIETRGLKAISAGTFMGDSDHVGLFATLAIDK